MSPFVVKSTWLKSFRGLRKSGVYPSISYYDRHFINLILSKTCRRVPCHLMWNEQTKIGLHIHAILTGCTFGKVCGPCSNHIAKGITFLHCKQVSPRQTVCTELALLLVTACIKVIPNLVVDSVNKFMVTAKMKVHIHIIIALQTVLVGSILFHVSIRPYIAFWSLHGLLLISNSLFFLV